MHSRLGKCPPSRRPNLVDIVDQATRSRMMAAVPQKHTRPERIVRTIAHSLGYRFRLHIVTLPGSPDLVFPRLRRVIFVHGCFWHRHSCSKATTPSNNRDFWQQKFVANQRRDRRAIRALRRLGWRPLVVWECEVARPDRLVARISRFLDAGNEQF